MGALILGLVLIIGYFYQTQHPIRRLELVRSSGYHIYFKAGFSGLVFLVPSVFVWSLIDYYNIPSAIFECLGLKKTITVIGDTEYWDVLKIAAIFLFVFFFSSLHVKIVKGRFPKNSNKLLKEVKKRANNLEKLIISSSADIKAIRVDLNCGKVYVGIPQNPDLEDGELTHLTMLPLLSGSRDKNLDIKFSNNYYKHYENKHPGENHGELDWDAVYDFKIIIPTKDIVVASSFDPDAFLAISKDNSSELINSAEYKEESIYNSLRVSFTFPN
ncbi:MAG: hypothetical protein Alis3KO_26400 [Aliiglaciecola sp.]